MDAAASFYHKPVLLDECIDGLNINPNGIYVDGTLGGGGHAAVLCGRLTTGRFVGIDRDAEAIEVASHRLFAMQVNGRPRMDIVRGNFHDVKALLSGVGIHSIDGALVDLGVSSHQLDEGTRGFSYHEDAPLDMRMDTAEPLTARDIVNGWPQGDIVRILRDFGEEQWAVQIARVICDRRRENPIHTTLDLVRIIDIAVPKKVRMRDTAHPARRTFQALRIAVNDELEPLSRALEDFTMLLAPGGRLAVIAFHSLEDRLVKQTFRRLINPCECPSGFPVCVCGKKPVARAVTRKPIVAASAELEDNVRARSATLRIIEKIGNGDA